jgi:ribosome recycling factor
MHVTHRMVSMTLSVPDELKKAMEKFPEINWSEIARQAIKTRLAMLKEIREFTKDSELTEDDAIKLGREVNKALARRYNKWKP